MHPPLKKMWGYNICYIPPSSRPTTGSWGRACNDTQNINVKNTQFVVTTWVLSSSECTKTHFRWGLCPRPRQGAYVRHSPDPLVGWGGAHPLPILLPLISISPPSPLLLKEIYANDSATLNNMKSVIGRLMGGLLHLVHSLYQMYQPTHQRPVKG